MPRLLLVDDNPSIHRIAESLLAPTDVELVCVDSAAEALDRFTRGERFDVALIDTTMPGMDGWTLLARLRDMAATANLPIALMAGVLDPVDPNRLAKAPIQGFLKKPIELRELGDRVRALLATPVTLAAEPGPAAASPAQTAEFTLPEILSDFPSAGGGGSLPPLEPAPAPEVVAPEPEEDLLILTAEDLWPEESAAEPVSALAAQPAVPEVHLELEELDLDGIHDLTSTSLSTEPVALSPFAEPPSAPSEPPPVEAMAPPAEPLAEESLSFTGLESFDELEGGLELPPLPEPPAAIEAPSALAEVGGVAALAGLAAAALPVLETSHTTPVAPAEALAALPAPEPAHEPTGGPWTAPAAAPQAEPAPAAPGHADAAPGQAALTPDQVQALLADPALMDALVKAVVARMGDQVVREIAWEVMPEVAGRLQR
ncbi:response regulator [Geothrix oryzisoli]|uniref:response regulator n=1 Tax=Geothrix oryzisoli TaxID=2922721 RepID=UPI001FAE07D7|nr:response regulator [Geothrix oryzisoli]